LVCQVVVALARGLGAHRDRGADLAPGRARPGCGESVLIAPAAGILSLELRLEGLVKQGADVVGERAAGASHPPL
jgi:hypothetical protein